VQNKVGAHWPMRSFKVEYLYMVKIMFKIHTLGPISRCVKLWTNFSRITSTYKLWQTQYSNV